MLQLTASLSGSPYSVEPNFLGFNNNWVRETDRWRNDTIMRRAFVDTHSSILRYPGGTNSAYWDYANDKIYTDLDPDRISADWVRNATNREYSNPIEELGLIKNEAGDDLTILLVANLTNQQAIPSSAPESPEWYAELDTRYGNFKGAITRLINIGIPIKYVELGNEYYFDTRYFGNVAGEGAFPGTGASYAIAANYFATKLKADYPGVKCAAVGTAAHDGNQERRRRWNENVVPLLDKNVIDAITVHFYHNNRPPAGFDVEAGVGQTFNSWEREWRERSTANAVHSRVPVMRGIADDWDVWFTEFGSFQHDQLDYWHYAFYVSNAFDNWLRYTRCTMLTIHSWKPTYNEDQPYVKGLKMWALACRGQSVAERLVLPNIPIVRTTEHEGVIGWKFSGDSDSVGVVLCNYTQDSHTVDLSGVLPNQRCEVFSAHTIDLLGHATEETSSQDTAVITLPPFSVNAVLSIASTPIELLKDRVEALESAVTSLMSQTGANIELAERLIAQENAVLGLTAQIEALSAQIQIERDRNDQQQVELMQKLSSQGLIDALTD